VNKLGKNRQMNGSHKGALIPAAFMQALSSQSGFSRKKSLIAAGVSAIMVFTGVTVALNHSSAQQNLGVTPINAAGATAPLVSNVVTDSQSASPSIDVTSNGDTSSNATGSSSVDATIDNGQASVTVDGQPVGLPQNGSVHKTVTTDGNQTDVNISVSNNGSTTNKSQSHLNVSTFSSSHTTNNSYNHSSTTGGGTP